MRGLSLDVGGTLIVPAEPVEDVYRRLGEPFGVGAVDFRVEAPGLTQSGDGRPFWREVVRRSTGCADLDYFEQLYAHYARPEAWTVRPGARELLDAWRYSAIVSNWDTRLRQLLWDLGLDAGVILISGELGVEKPDRRIFMKVCHHLGLEPGDVTHVGDSLRDDVEGARAAGFKALHWGTDVSSFAELGAMLSAC